MPHASCRCINNATLAETTRGSGCGNRNSPRSLSILFSWLPRAGDAATERQFTMWSTQQHAINHSPTQRPLPSPLCPLACALPCPALTLSSADLPSSVPNCQWLLHFRFPLKYTKDTSDRRRPPKDKQCTQTQTRRRAKKEQQNEKTYSSRP